MNKLKVKRTRLPLVVIWALGVLIGIILIIGFAAIIGFLLVNEAIEYTTSIWLGKLLLLLSVTISVLITLTNKNLPIPQTAIAIGTLLIVLQLVVCLIIEGRVVGTAFINSATILCGVVSAIIIKQKATSKPKRSKWAYR